MEMETGRLRKNERFAGALEDVVAALYLFMLGSTLFVCLFFSFMNFSRKQLTAHYLPPLFLLAIGAAFLFLVFLLFEKLPPLGKGRWLLLLFTVLLFSYQVFSAYHYWFFTSWDVPNVIGLGSAAAHGESVNPWIPYYAQFPNNLFLCFVYSLIYRGAHGLGLHGQEHFIIICFQCLLNSLAGLLLAQTVHKLFRSRAAVGAGYALYVLLVGISPWVTIPYSDSTGLIFPMLIFTIYAYRDSFRFSWLPWGLMALLAIVGYSIKPQIFIILLAVLLAQLVQVIKRGEIRKNLRRLAAGLCALMIGALCGVQVKDMGVKSLHIPIEKGHDFGPAHFLMMGLNTETMGAYYGEDVRFSGSFPTKEERDRADLRRAAERVKEMGAVGLVQQMARKTLTNYYDGTFAWGGEGGFFAILRDEPDNGVARFYKELFYTGAYSPIGEDTGTGKYYPIWSNMAEALWMGVLLFGVLAVFGGKSPEKTVLLLAILGLTLFELLFEARARYLFTYVPLYIILAVYGAAFVRARAGALLKKWKA